MSGGSGDDEIHGFSGNDTATGDAGNEQIYDDDPVWELTAVGDGLDTFSGGDGDDISIRRFGGR